MASLTKTINISDEDFFEDQSEVGEVKEGGDDALSVVASSNKNDLEDDDVIEDDQSDVLDGGKNIVLQLSQDPLYIVLCQFLKSKSGKNITDVLEEIKESITELNERLDKLATQE